MPDNWLATETVSGVLTKIEVEAVRWEIGRDGPVLVAAILGPYLEGVHAFRPGDHLIVVKRLEEEWGQEEIDRHRERQWYDDEGQAEQDASTRPARRPTEERRDSRGEETRDD